MDKFNRHLHTRRDSDPSVVTTYTYETILLVLGALTDSNGNIIMFKDNWSPTLQNLSPTNHVYEIPVKSCIIKSVRWSPEDAEVYLNDNKHTSDASLIGLSLVKGDKIRAKAVPGAQSFFVLEIVVEITIKCAA